MRLRYLHLWDFPPLNDVNIVFEQEPLLARQLAIRFIVGVNGTGKTRLLQALTEMFLSLARQRIPPFPINLAYDLGTESDRRTIYLCCTSGSAASEAVLIEYESVLPDNTLWDTIPDAPERNRFPGNALPGTGTLEAFLPAPLLVYTSGSTNTWQTLFSYQLAESEEALSMLNGTEATTAERPLGWDAQQEREYLLRSDQVEQAQQIQIPDPGIVTANAIASNMAFFVTTEQLKLATFSVTLCQAIKEWNSSAERTPPTRDGLQELLDEINWEASLSVVMDIDFRPDRLPPPQAKMLYALITLAAGVYRDPKPGTRRRLVFELPKSLSVESVTIAEKLLEILGGENPTPFEVFRTLYEWQKSGLLRDLNLTLRKSGIDDVLLYDWLSDGERMFLGRIALFHLLKERNNAMLILDEPETHFNDIWKRRLVDILDDALGNLASDVLISTHSSIVLTDVFAEEIELLRIEDGTTVVGRVTMPTFGADPSEIMINVFDAPDSLGKRALEYLDKQLKRDWRVEELDKLEYLIRHIGSGYHRSELRTIWRKLRATQD